MTLSVILVGCIGQSPADLKNKITNSEEKISSSCQGIKFDGELLTKTNIVKIFECGTWKENYPEFYQAIKKIPDEELNSLLAPYNNHIFYDRNKQGKFLDIISAHSQSGNLEQLGVLLNKALGEYGLLSQLDLVLSKSKLTGIDRSLVLNVFSKDSQKNISAIKTLSHFLDLYHQDKSSWDKIFSTIEKEVLVRRGVKTFDQLASLESTQLWKTLSVMTHPETSFGLKKWAQISLSEGQYDALLTTLVSNKNLVKDSIDLKRILKDGLSCTNAASDRGFVIRAEKELVTKMTDLAELDRDGYQRSVVDGAAKLIAFKNFCQNPQIENALNVFSSITHTIMNASEMERDYLLIQTVQKTLPQGNEFGIVDFLSGASFEAIHQTVTEIHDQNESALFSEKALEIISSLQDEDYLFLSSLISDLTVKSYTQKWYQNWATMWNKLTVEEKEEFVHLLSIVVDKDLDSSKAMRVILDVVNEFPEVTKAVSDQFDNSLFYDSLRHQISLLSEEKVRNDVARFFSNDGIVAFLKVFTRGREVKLEAQAPLQKRTSHLQMNSFTLLAKVRNENSQKQCYSKLHQDYLNNKDYYTIVNTLPEVCLSSLGEFGLVGQIYLWMNHLNAEFKTVTGKEFHTGLGVWSPGMLQFIFSAAVKADNYLGRSQGQGVKAHLTQIEADLNHPVVKERVNLILKLSKEISDRTRIFDLLVSDISQMNDEHLRQNGATFFKMIGADATPYFTSAPKQISCKDLNSELGVNPCMTANSVKASLFKILEIAKRKNEKGDSVIKSLLGALHPDRGVVLTRNGKKTEKHVITLEEIIRFAHDLNSQQTIKEFPYFNKGIEKKHQGTSIDRLEVIIRDIAFLDNFYGAYFKNEVAHADNYRKKLEDSEKLMNWLQRFSGPFRSLGVFPKETKWLLKNARYSYSSLIEVADEYPQFDGGTKNYANFIQSVLMIASSTSPEKAQNFGAFRKPNIELVKNHNGMFITEITKISGLRHLSSWVESRFGDNYAEILKSEDFQRVNKELLKKVTPDQLEKVGEYLLENYFKNDQDVLAEMISDFVDWLYLASPEDIKAFESVVSKILILAAQDQMKNTDFVTLAEYLELIIKNWASVKKSWPQNVPLAKVFKLADQALDNILKHKSDSAELIHTLMLTLKKLPQSEREALFAQEVLIKMSELLKHFFDHDFKAQFSWSNVFADMFFSSSTKQMAFKNFLTRMVDYPQEELVPADYIEFLLSNKNGKSRYELFVEEVFVNQREKLEKFLDSTFQALQ